MAKIVYDDWREEEFNQEDFISKADLDEKYISREELEDNYVTREKYEAKKKQAKQAFANQDKAKQEALAEEADAMAQRIREEISLQQSITLIRFLKKLKLQKNSILLYHGNRLIK